MGILHHIDINSLHQRKNIIKGKITNELHYLPFALGFVAAKTTFDHGRF